MTQPDHVPRQVHQAELRKGRIEARVGAGGAAIAALVGSDDMEARGGARAADHQAMMAELRAGLAEADRALADLPRIIEEAMAESEAARAEGQRRVVVKHECKPGSGEVTETTAKGGVQVISICRSRIMAEARQGLVEARAEIAADKDIPEDTRKQILRTLDAQIARWSRQEG